MAQGKTAHVSVNEVCSTVDSLEVSPSHHSESSPIYGNGGKTAVQPETHTGKTHSGHRGTRETPQKFSPAHSKRGH